ncbi:hypothetical protein GCM10027614_32970 [Micromonospora vulcania]
MRRLVYELSELAENPRPRDSIDTLFEAMWPRLEIAVAEARSASGPATEPRRTLEDMLAELVTRVRNIEREIEQKESDSHLEAKFIVDQLAHTRRALEVQERAAAHAAANAEATHASYITAKARAAELEMRLAEVRTATDTMRRKLAEYDQLQQEAKKARERSGSLSGSS